MSEPRGPGVSPKSPSGWRGAKAENLHFCLASEVDGEGKGEVLESSTGVGRAAPVAVSKAAGSLRTYVHTVT